MIPSNLNVSIYLKWIDSEESQINAARRNLSEKRAQWKESFLEVEKRETEIKKIIQKDKDTEYVNVSKISCPDGYIGECFKALYIFFSR